MIFRTLLVILAIGTIAGCSTSARIERVEQRFDAKIERLEARHDEQMARKGRNNRDFVRRLEARAR